VPTARETILAALQARLSALPATALRGAVLPECVPADGLLIPRDGEPGEPEGRRGPSLLVVDRAEVRFADSTLVTQALGGEACEACELEFDQALPSGEGLRLTAHAVYLPRSRSACRRSPWPNGCPSSKR